MLTSDVRNLILNCKLREEGVTVPGWEGANLVIRELSAKAGTELIKMCSGEDDKLNQDDFVAGIILATLRNADEPGAPLVFGYEDGRDEANPAYKDALMATGLGRVMDVAKRSIKLSGLDEKAAVDEAKNDSGATSAESSPTTSQAA